jgi:hypothetical protein
MPLRYSAVAPAASTGQGSTIVRSKRPRAQLRRAVPAASCHALFAALGERTVSPPPGRAPTFPEGVPRLA